MKIAIFGGTGRTGLHVIEQALEEGHQVVTLARTPTKLTFKQDSLKVVQGDVKDPASVASVVKGVDAVISVLGPTSNAASFEVSSGMENILKAMNQYDVKRIILSAGAGVGDPQDKPGFVNKLINALLKMVAKNVYEDMLKAVAIVRSSDRDWTVVRVPMLTDGPKTGNIKVGMVGKGMGSRISRADMATYMLNQIHNTDQVRKAPVISN
ncbi:MAG TPA: SDR family oxidoreductase [Anaerolineaceae bacterium]|nr:SDR family oxidoreductase [Anaerolineaceae bacterium]